jgi:hypothetical protein
VFGECAIIQRCQAHKIRNVVDQLPDEMKPSVRQAMRDAYAASDADRAHTMLKNLVRRLHDKHPGAAGSLEEGLDDTLSVKRLRLPKKLERQLSTTYRMLANAGELYQQPFIPGWINDLTATDPYYVLPVILFVTMFLQARLQPASADSTQQKFLQYVHGELLADDALMLAARRDELLRDGRGLALGDLPTDDVAAEQVEDDVQRVVRALRRSWQLRCVPRPHPVRRRRHQLRLDVHGMLSLRAALTDLPGLGEHAVHRSRRAQVLSVFEQLRVDLRRCQVHST